MEGIMQIGICTDFLLDNDKKYENETIKTFIAK